MSIAAMLKPRSVAVIGAGESPSSVGGRAFYALVDHHFGGDLYPVNPRHKAIAGYPCYPSVGAIPAVPDVVLILLPPARALEALAECATKGVKHALLLSAGYAEVGGEGVQFQRKLVEIATESGIRVLGPNCGGMVNVVDDIPLGFFPSLRLENFPRGHVGVVAQSGGVGAILLNKAYDRGIGLSHMITTGNEADLSCADFLQFLVDDPATRSIALYVEGLTNPRGLMKGIEAALAARKPVVLFKGGVSPEGEAAASSHTAALTTSLGVLEVALKQKGVALVDDLDDLLDIAAFLARPFKPHAATTVPITTSGGMGVMAADQLEKYNVPFARLKPDTVEALQSILPSFAAVRNPLDITAQYLNQPDLFARCVRVLAAAEEVGVIMPSLAMVGDNAARFARDIVEVTEETGVPMAVAWSTGSLVEEGYKTVRAAGIPVFHRVETAARAIGFALDYLGRADAARARLTGPPSPRVPAPRRGARDFEVLEWLRAQGVSVAPARLATTPDEAVAAAEALGYPVALKVVSRQVPHKTEAGGLRLDLRSPADVRDAWGAIVASVRRCQPDAVIDGLMVQKMMKGNVEAIVGLKRDPRFGWAVMVGLGGIFTEVLHDVSLRLAPVTPEEAEAMLKELRGTKLLEGARGRPRADAKALAGLVSEVSILGASLGDAARELDLNPVLVLDAGQGVACVDALLVEGEP